MFSTVATIESLTNLYYNQLLNKDLSEQSIVSCHRTGSCAGGWALSYVNDYVATYGVCEEVCFPYTGTDNICSNKCPNPKENIKISGWMGTYPKTDDAIKRNIIKYGPLSSAISSSPGINWRHAMSLIGYKTIEVGDIIHTDQYTYITIPPNDSRIGRTAWLFKNSGGADAWHGGWVYALIDNLSYLEADVLFSPITSPNYTVADIVCEDRDGDGYYFWGIGSKPATCPSCSPNTPDGDDSDPDLGPMNEYGYCEVITTPLVENITAIQTWGVNKNVCQNVVVHFDATLTITANIELSNHKITVRNGGKLILDGGFINNGNVVVENGGEFKTLNNGKILLGGGDFEIKSGAKSEMYYGEISRK